MTELPERRSLLGQNRSGAPRWAFLAHRISGLALAFFLPIHFYFLSTALDGFAAFDAALNWAKEPWLEASMVVLVLLLVIHCMGGLRLLLAKYVAWKREWQPSVLALGGGFLLLAVLSHALKLGV